MNILLVDDSKTMRNIQKKAIAALGEVNIIEADDGLQGLAAFTAQQGGVQLALIDWNMPNMNGLELIERIRAMDSKVLLIMVTTEAERSRVLDALRAGVNNYVVKPFTPDALLEKVRQTIEKAYPLRRAA